MMVVKLHLSNTDCDDFYFYDDLICKKYHSMKNSMSFLPKHILFLPNNNENVHHN